MSTEHAEPDIVTARRAIALISANRAGDSEGFTTLLNEVAAGGGDLTTATIVHLTNFTNYTLSAILGDRAGSWLDQVMLGTAIAETKGGDRPEGMF